MAFLGLHNASVYPYQSLIAIERIGMTEPAYALMLVLAVLFGWPRDGQTAWADTRSGLSLGQSFRDIAHLHILSRLLFIGALAAGIRADQTANRRGIALWACGLMVAGAVSAVVTVSGAVALVWVDRKVR